MKKKPKVEKNFKNVNIFKKIYNFFTVHFLKSNFFNQKNIFLKSNYSKFNEKSKTFKDDLHIKHKSCFNHFLCFKNFSFKKIILFIFVILLISSFISYKGEVLAEEVQNDVEIEIENNVEEQINRLDFNSVEQLLERLEILGSKIFGDSSFSEKVKQIISGDFKILGEDIWHTVINLILEEILQMLPLMATILAIGILSGMLGQFRLGDKSGKGVGDVIHFICYGMIIILVSSSIVQLISFTSTTLSFVKELIDVIFPILLTLLTAIGGNTSVGIYQPAIGLLSGTILHIFNAVLVPIFIFSFVFVIISNLTTTVKVEKFSSFFHSLFKWITASVFTIFIAFVSIQGITAGSIDGISAKTAKFAIKSYVPFLGNYLADGFNVIVASSVLIKNAIGFCGLIILFSVVIMPILHIAIFGLLLKLVASILEPLSDGKISNFLFGISKTLSMLIAILVGVSFMFLLIVGLVMCTANFI